jgi:hypothetical protein
VPLFATFHELQRKCARKLACDRHDEKVVALSSQVHGIRCTKTREILDTGVKNSRRTAYFLPFYPGMSRVSANLFYQVFCYHGLEIIGPFFSSTWEQGESLLLLRLPVPGIVHCVAGVSVVASEVTKRHQKILRACTILLQCPRHQLIYRDLSSFQKATPTFYVAMFRDYLQANNCT